MVWRGDGFVKLLYNIKWAHIKEHNFILILLMHLRNTSLSH